MPAPIGERLFRANDEPRTEARGDAENRSMQYAGHTRDRGVINLRAAMSAAPGLSRRRGVMT